MGSGRRHSLGEKIGLRKDGPRGMILLQGKNDLKKSRKGFGKVGKWEKYWFWGN
jgi:hypothetical protein